ncbi:undecaprenyl-diphosphatase [Plesiomonas shigelloides]|uniref:Undecaprenyl-diphosphatase n=1 Tax=Plesiomonas shigelloides TaxID=703 RepID=A0A8I2B4K0_PLESH|nr:undecaprenyl-diphosphatase [Plesiomonas shigelloides]MBO1109811.1 undecaprenyl-diphosphatase [Plesiomonas shigelloides]
MENLNHQLFLWLNASANPNLLLVGIAIVFAEYLIFAIPAMIFISWLNGDEHCRKTLLVVTVAVITSFLINVLIGFFWQHPRPFMIGLGHTLIPHVPDSSFPSDHLTLIWTVAFSLIAQRHYHKVGLALAISGFPVAWARIYLGVHFPFDMAGSIFVALLSSWITVRLESVYIDHLYKITLAIHRTIFSKFIKLGWVRP